MKLVECLLLISLSYACHALSWNSLWSTPDQRAQHLMKQKQYQQAQQTFQDPSWKAAASYRAGNYEEAAALYQTLETEDAFYNQGNALAQLGKYEQAIKAYDQALDLNAEHKDALFNRKLIKALLKKEKQSADKKQDQGQDQDSQKNNSSSQPNTQNPSKKESLKKQAESKASEKAGESSSNEAVNPDNSQQASPNPSAEKKTETKSQEKKAALNSEETKGSSSSESAEQISLNKEQQLTKDQWLKLIPDDPGGLLREKFLREHLRRQQGW